MSLLLIPKNVVIAHIVPHLTYKERTKLYSTCRRFWSMKTDEYIYGEWDRSYFFYSNIHVINKQQTGYMIYTKSNNRKIWHDNSNSLWMWLKNGNYAYFCKNKDSIKRKLISYWNRFGVIEKKRKQ